MQADLALVNAKVRTMNPAQPKAEAVAIKKDRILKVGTNETVATLIGKDTRVIDLNGKTIVPGFIDTHIHVADFGKCLLWLDLNGVKSIKELQNRLKEHAKATASGRWIVGRGWNQACFREKRLPTSTDLDSASSDTPVILYHESAMMCVVNSKALELTGVTKLTPDPAGGKIDREAKTGELTGILRDSATELVWKRVPEPSEDELLEATALACRKIAEAGVTSVHWMVLSANEIPIMRMLQAQKKLPIRVNAIIPANLLDEIQDFRSNDSSALRVGGAVIATDGYLASKTAALFEPYNGEPETNGELLCTQEDMNTDATKIITAGLQLVIQAMGDRAVDAALTAVEQSKKSNVKVGRCRIEQAAVLNKALVERIRAQQVIVSVQPRVIASEFAVWSATENLGAERARWLYPLKTLLRNGVRVIGGSDCPMEPLNPLLGIQEAATRQNREQRLTVEEALRMYTVDAAYASNEENLKGTIQEGKLADLTVLSCDPESAKPNQISENAVEMTIVGGEILFHKL